jgi:hypothetical protein
MKAYLHVDNGVLWGGLAVLEELEALVELEELDELGV